MNFKVKSNINYKNDRNSRNYLTFQLCSDFRFENTHFTYQEQMDHCLNKKIIPSADVLLVAGNVGNVWQREYVMFLNWVSKNFFKVFLVAGNVEYHSWTKTLLETENELKRLCSEEYQNVYFLQESVYKLPWENKLYIILGCTLWYQIPQYLNLNQIDTFNGEYFSLHNKMIITETIKDENILDELTDIEIDKPEESEKNKNRENFNNGQIKERIFFTSENSNLLYKFHSRWIFHEVGEIKYAEIPKSENEISSSEFYNKAQEGRDMKIMKMLDKNIYTKIDNYATIIVLTHFSPSSHLSKINPNDNFHECNNLDWMITSHIRLWACGHTQQYNKLVKENSTTLITNPVQASNYRNCNCIELT